MAIVALGSLCAPPAFALDATTPFRDYAIDHWTVDNGLPQLSVLSVTQDRSGYLWIGTQNGIARFDGLHFDVFDRSNSNGVDTTDASSSLSDSQGRLWFGTTHGALLYADGQFRKIPVGRDARGVASVGGIAESAAGQVLFATSAGVLRYTNGSLLPDDGDATPSYSIMRQGATIWVGGIGAVTRNEGGVKTVYALPPHAAKAQVTQLAAMDSAIWIGTSVGLFRLQDNSIQAYELQARGAGWDSGTPASGVAGIESLHADRDNNLWIGTASRLVRLRPDGDAEAVRDEDFVHNAYVVSMFEDREGNLWLGSRTESLFRLWNGWAKRIGMREGLPDPLIWSVARDPAGQIAFGSNSNVMQLTRDGLHELIPGKLLPHPAAYELSYDGQGRLWVGTRSGIAVFDHGRITTPAELGALASYQINAIVHLPDGGAWIGTHGGLYRYRPGELVHVGPSAGSAAARVRSIYVEDPEHLLIGTEAGVRRVSGDSVDTPVWAAQLDGVFISSITSIKPGLLGITTRDAGIGLVAADKLLMLSTEHGLPTSNGWTMQVVDGQLYVTTIDGVWRVPVAQLPDPATGEAQRLTTEVVLGRNSGSQHMHCCNGGARSRSLIDGDGIWLPAIQGAVRLNTRAIVPPPLAPTAVVQGLRHEQDWMPSGNAIEIAPGRRDVELRFTGISFRDPQNLHFRYRLDGYDEAWQDAGTRRSAFYTNLPPGHFRFRVRAQLSDSVVSEQDGELVFYLLPHWYERPWVQWLLAGCALLLLVLAQVWLTHRYRRRGVMLEALVQDRTLELSQANRAEHRANLQLRSEIDERLAAELALKHRNDDLETLNHKLEGAQGQLLQSEKMASVGQLAAGVAHEINNPIGFVQSNLRSLEGYVQDILSLVEAYEKMEAALPDQGHAANVRAVKQRIDLAFLRQDIASLMAESLDGITRVVKIVRDLKDFSHVDEAEWQEADLHQGLDSTLNVVAHELKYKADVIKDYGELPPIECLPFQLNQVFLNLLLNSAQAMDSRGTITIRTGRDADNAWIAISDTGKGIEPSHLNRIFEPFFTTKPVGTGTGLGLSVSYNIVQKHGGTIDVASVVGKGTTFTIRLPIKAQNQHRKAA